MTQGPNLMKVFGVSGRIQEESTASSALEIDSGSVDHSLPFSAYVNFNKFFSKRVSQSLASGRVPTSESIYEEFQAYSDYKILKHSYHSIFNNCKHRRWSFHNASSAIQALRATLNYDKTLWLADIRQSFENISSRLTESEFNAIKDKFRNHFESVKHFFSELSGKLRSLATALSVTDHSADKRETIRKKTKLVFTKTDDEDLNK